ncbi:ATP-dependent RNA helicase HrpA [Ilumatobacter nonamiensis]|uniref:ATP-dependent RNA helicase HrpA n=1 Tax=Ilumatobacter nonamiensis TaxID=467093 RepID=UPI00058C4B4C|nr:ATP-dependent RNA helicase HrpA [Ilumatobacter nonamiensis]
MGAQGGEPKRRAAAAAILADDRLNYPPDLPITERHDELLDVIRDHQVVIVAGETGSGKSTQIPKLCIEAGRGVDGVIGHTQPRRVAARTIAERVADELETEVGEDVGYSVRFTDNISDGTLIRVMTDGILLAEIQRDRMLRRYDTLIIDEAHERSLNIDFILGYLKQLLPRRPDLKVIVTSATIDTERFATHFADGEDHPAPIVSVSGRMYPVEVRYRDPGDDLDQVDAIVEACEELADEGDGDVLVFLSGEREIHDTADAIKQRRFPNTEVLPLYARLSSAEQKRVWQPHRGRRIVLATNVAETSITVPGVRYVVDAGTARISRYSRRLKVQRLPIEEVSQASANQRAGRCGRVAPGICIRLYSEENFEERPDFTEPEILRTNLASVILQMANIGLGDLGRFPFVEAPERRSIRDGEMLLEELNAIASDTQKQDGVRLTKMGRRLARLPVDPRLGRMLLEAEQRNCVREVLVIVSALSIQDVRERPADKREKANEFHNRFKVKGSDLLSIVKLWDYVREQQRELSGNRFRRMCRDEFIHYLRVREWVDLHRQLKRVAADIGIRAGTDEGHPDHVHQALLAGLLSHIGMRDRQTRMFKGARQAEFVIAPGSVLTRKPADWVMAAELVETNQIYARRVAEIDPRWAERAGAHLVKKSYGEPRWDVKGGRAVVTEQVTLYGLPLVSHRVIGLDRVDPEAARAWFITKVFVEGGDQLPPGWAGRHRFLTRNQDELDRLASMSARTRGAELVDDETLFAFYDERIGDDVTSTQHFDRWWKKARKNQATLLDLTADVLGDHGVGSEFFPDVWRQGEIELPLTYRDAPGEPLDGVTIHLPLNGLNQITEDGFDWQIPGHRDELVEQLMRSLPKAIRRELIPFAETVDDVLDRLGPPTGRLVDRLATVVGEVADVRVTAAAFDPTVIDAYLKLNIVVSDDEGEVHDAGTDLTAIKSRLAGSARSSIAAAAPIEERRGITTWDVGDLPRVVESSERALDVRAYPTLLDAGDSVSLRVVTTPELQQRAMRGGVRRLLMLDGAPTRRSIERLITNAGRIALANADIGVDTLVDDCIEAALDVVMAEHGSLPWTEREFAALQSAVRAKAPNRAGVALGRAVTAVAAAASVNELLARLRAPAFADTVHDANLHLARLVRPGFVSAHGIDRLDDVDRYVRGIRYRLEHLGGAADRDRVRMGEVWPLEARFDRFVDHAPPGGLPAEATEIRWLLEELRIQVFAQPIGTRGSVSSKKVAQRLATLGA